MRHKKILFIIPRFGSVNRGVESYALELISRLDKSKHEISVLSTDHDIIIDGVNFIKMKALKRERFKWLDQSRALRKIGRAVGLGSGADIEAFSLCFNSRNHINQVYDFVLPLGGSWTYRFAHRFFNSAKIINVGQAGPVKDDLKMSDVFIALTPYDESLAKHMVKEINTKVIPNGVDISKFKPVSSKKNNDQKVILCVAALSKEKRHDLLFDAVMLLPSNITVLCVGSGPHKEILERHPLALADRVEFRAVNYQDMPNIYHEADLFSLASPEETFGIVFLEAIASGLPLVAHNGPRQNYVVNNCGCLCDVFNREEYSAALKKAFNIRHVNYQEHLRAFDWQVIRDEYTNLFHNL